MRIMRSQPQQSETLESVLQTIEEETTRELLSCGRCSTVYLSRNQLEHHLKTNCGKIKNYVCHCGSRYLTEASLNQHKISHEGQKKFLCDFCGKSFLSKGQLKIHERTHTNDKPFGCGICNKRFAYRESLITHSSIHTGIKPYLCQCCKKTFSCIGNLLKHRRTRPDTCGSKEYTEVTKIAPRPMTKNLAIPTIIEKKPGKSGTKTTGKSSELQLDDNLVDEMQGETITLVSTTLVGFVENDDDEEQITLIVTDVDDKYDEETIIVKNDDDVLVLNENNSEDISSYVTIEDSSLACRLCPKIYKSSKVILSHLHKEHQIELKDDSLQQIQTSLKSQSIPQDKTKCHTCLKCGKTFSSRTVLSDHERSNCGTKPVYVCEICSKGYHSAGSLKTHKTVHTGELNHICPYCGQSFRTAGQVKIHSRKHTGVKPYKCKKCDKSFGHRESLLTHESVHSGVKRFMCKCGQRFSCISNLKAHRRSHKDKCGKFPMITKPVVTIEGVTTKNVNK